MLNSKLITQNSKLTAALLTAAFVLPSCALFTPPIVGTWQVTGSGRREKIAFDRDGTGRIMFSGRAPLERFTYEVDGSKTPAWIDIRLTEDVGGGRSYSHVVKGIVRFDSRDKMRIKAADRMSGPRPASFSRRDRGDLDILERVK